MQIRALLLVYFCLVFSLCHARQPDADSLEKAVSTMATDTLKAWQLNQLAGILREQDSHKAMAYANEARNLSLALNYQRGLAYALENLGWIYYRKGDYTTAFEISAEAMAISEKINDKFCIVRCLNNIAAINVEQNQQARAVSNFKKAYDLSLAIRDSSSMARSLNNIAFVFLKTNQMDSARNYVEMALRITRNTGDKYLAAFALRTRGDIYLSEGDFKAAFESFAAVIRISEEVGNVFLKASTFHRIGNTFVSLGEMDKALAYLLPNVALSRKHDFRSELELSLKLISDIYAAKKDVGKAYAYQNEYLKLHDSLYQQRSSEQMALMQARFDSEMKEAKIQLLTKNAELKQIEMNNQRTWMYFSIGLLSLMAVLAFVLLYSNRLKKKANDAFALKNEEISQQAQQLQNLNVTKDKLLSIISHDIRSPLASLRGLIDVMVLDGLSREDFISTSRKLGRNLESVQDDLDNLLLWTQSQLKGLQSNPVPLKVYPIINEKIRLFGEIARQKEITIRNEINDALSVVADKNHVGLVMRNLLANAIKFNRQGGSIMIREKNVGEYVEISVSDTGVGMSAVEMGKLFKPDTHFTKPGTKQEKGVGIGLLLTKEFIEKNGGSIWATSEPGKGTTFTFRIKQHYALVESEVE